MGIDPIHVTGRMVSKLPVNRSTVSGRVAAGYLPARRGSTVDPMSALRSNYVMVSRSVKVIVEPLTPFKSLTPRADLDYKIYIGFVGLPHST